MNILKPFIAEEFVLHSRLSLSRTFSNNKDLSLFIKRDDELSAMISGSKYRKYAALIPYLKQKKIKNCVLIGSSFSNNLVGLSQLLIENGITPWAVVLKSSNKTLQGNFLFLKMLIPSSQIFEIERSQWNQKEAFSKKLSKDLKECFVLNEGALHPVSTIGSMTLGFDILENEKLLDLSFDQIFLDCGSGGSAIGFLLSLNFFKTCPKVHIVSMTMNQEEFQKIYDQQRVEVSKLLNTPLKSFDYSFSKPLKYQSFGSHSPQLFKSLIKTVREEGIFFDPVYSLKLYLETQRLLSQTQDKTNNLLVHSGGSLTLSGFQQTLKDLIDQEERDAYSNNKDHSHM